MVLELRQMGSGVLNTVGGLIGLVLGIIALAAAAIFVVLYIKKRQKPEEIAKREEAKAKKEAATAKQEKVRDIASFQPAAAKVEVKKDEDKVEKFAKNIRSVTHSYKEEAPKEKVVTKVDNRLKNLTSNSFGSKKNDGEK